MAEVKMICPYCEKDFIRVRNAQKYCSDKCRRLANRKNPTIQEEELREYTCSYCGKTFKWDRKKRYCSDECRELAAGRRIRKPKKPKGLSIDAISRLAFKENLSYGQYVAKYGL